MTRFARFAAIDWSGAVGQRHHGIAVALCEADGGPPHLMQIGNRWSRQEVLEWLLGDLPSDALVGLDLGISLPFADAGAFFPGWRESPPDARGLWRLVDEICAEEPHLAATSFVDHPQLSRYFRRHAGREGDRFHLGNAGHKRGRFRVTEEHQAAAGCRPYSNFNLVGAAQVGKSSLTGMRVLHRLGDAIPVWPIDPLPEAGPVIVEIYTALAALAAGRSASRTKMTDLEALNAALANLGSPAIRGAGAIDDHSADALLTAAWLRSVADRPALWRPPALSPRIARTEGWTFGAT